MSSRSSCCSVRATLGTLIVAMALVTGAFPATAFRDEYILLDEGVYPLLLRLRALGAPVHENLSTLPITRGQAASIVRDTRAALESGTLSLSRGARRQLEYLEAELAPELGGPVPGRYHEARWDAHHARIRWAVTSGIGRVAVLDPRFELRNAEAGQSVRLLESTIVSVQPEATLQLGDHLIVQERLNVSWLSGDGVTSSRFGVSQGGAVIDRGIDQDGFVRRSFDTLARLVFGEIALEAGRMHVHWGHGRRGTLLISDATPPADLVRVVGSTGRFSFTNMAMELRTDIGQRFAVMHRLSYSTPSLTLSASESVIFGNRAFDLAYVNPFQLLVAAEDNIGQRDNNFVGLDARWRPRAGLELWTEALLDDWNLRKGLDTFANKIAIQAGAVVAGLPGLPDSDLALEYTIVDQFTYSHVEPINAATHYGDVVGHRIGTDADLSSATLTHWVSPGVEIAGRFEIERHGEGDISRDHSTRTDERHHFLSGTRETTRAIEAMVRLRAVRGPEARAGLRRAWIDRFGNDEAAPRVSATEGEVVVRFRF